MPRSCLHHKVREMLGAFADEELPRHTHQLIAAHVSGCARCQSELELQQSIAQALQLAPARVAPLELRLRIQRLTETFTPPATTIKRRRE
jgi:putative zinc finger protein